MIDGKIARGCFGGQPSRTGHQVQHHPDADAEVAGGQDDETHPSPVVQAPGLVDDQESVTNGVDAESERGFGSRHAQLRDRLGPVHHWKVEPEFEDRVADGEHGDDDNRSPESPYLDPPLRSPVRSQRSEAENEHGNEGDEADPPAALLEGEKEIDLSARRGGREHVGDEDAREQDDRGLGLQEGAQRSPVRNEFWDIPIHPQERPRYETRERELGEDRETADEQRAVPYGVEPRQLVQVAGDE